MSYAAIFIRASAVIVKLMEIVGLNGFGWLSSKEYPGGEDAMRSASFCMAHDEQERHLAAPVPDR